MKNTLRYLLIALALATTGLLAQAATDAPAPAPTPQAHHQTAKKVVKKGRKGKGHKKRGKPQKKQAK